MSITALAIVAFLAGLLLGLNPLWLNVFNNFIASKLGRGVSNARYTLMGIVLMVYVFILLIFFGALLSSVIGSLDVDTQQSLTLASSLLTIVVGLLLIRGYFFKKASSIPNEMAEKLHKKSIKKHGLINIIGLALIVLLSLLPILLAALSSLSIAGVFIEYNTLYWLVPFGIGFITPVYAVLALLSDSTKPSAISAWVKNSKPIIRLYSGLTLIALAWLVLYLVSAMEVF